MEKRRGGSWVLPGYQKTYPPLNNYTLRINIGDYLAHRYHLKSLELYDQLCCLVARIFDRYPGLASICERVSFAIDK
jgi:hypothetical protein